MLHCILCKKISLKIICTTCQDRFLIPTFSHRVLDGDFKVFSFYKYSDIAILLKTKHTYLGAQVYKILAENAMKPFSENFTFETSVYALGIDDHTESGYAHTAILTKSLSSDIIKPLFGQLRAKNNLHYSTKSLAYRLANKRGFSYHDNKKKDIILVDDIITTGTTILEAKKVIEKVGSTPMFALTLADAREL